MGLKASKIVSKSATEIIAEWSLGIPTSATEEAPTLFFKKTGVEAYYATTTSKISNPVVVTESAPADIKCSFSGGCKLELTATGLSS